MKDSDHFQSSYDFDDFDTYGNYSGRIEELDGHKNVYKMDYSSGLILGGGPLDYLFPAPNIGTIEFYFRTEDATDRTNIYFGMGSESIAPIYFHIEDDSWWGAVYPYLGEEINLAGGYKPKDNFWHHIRIDFDCSNERWMLNVDGHSSSWHGMFKMQYPPPPPLRIDYILLRTYAAPPDGASYFDAFGFSWDTSFYQTGDNFKEGLRLDFEIDTQEDIEWIGYSLDNQPNLEIPGPFTIPMPSYGLHNIKIYANDTYGSVYQSGTRYFMIGKIDPLSPNSSSIWEEGKTYDITWTWVDTITDINIDIYKGDNLQFSLGSFENNGVYSWSIPLDITRGSDWRIKISETSNSSNYGWSEYFEIVTSIQIISPENSSIWESGRSHTIRWATKGSIFNVEIDIYDNDTLIYSVANGTENDAEFNWYIPFGISPGTDWRVKITDSDNATIFGWSATFEVYTLKSISISNPIANTIWERGTSQYITWTTTGEIYWLDIEVYQGSTRLYVLTNGSENDGARFWEIPLYAEPGTNWRIRITDSNETTVFGWSDEFEIESRPDLLIIDPHSFSVWDSGNSYFIKWETSARVDIPFLDINIYRELGLLSYTMPKTVNDGEYLWTVPIDAPPGIEWYIRISDSGNTSVEAYSDEFEIYTDKSLTITTPDHSSKWAASRSYNKSHTITWTSTGIFSFVDIDIYKNNQWKYLINHTENDGYYEWFIPSDIEPGTDWKLKLTISDYASISDESELFEIFIIKTIDITFPYANITLVSGTHYDLTWSWTGNITNIKIELYKDGIFELTIDFSDYNDGRFLWEIPSEISESSLYQIKITDSSNSSVFDYSETYFRISKPVERFPEEILYIIIGASSVGTIAAVAYVVRKLQKRRRK